MDEDKRQALFSLSSDYLGRTIFVDSGTRTPNGNELAAIFAKLIGTARIYYVDAAIDRGLASSRSDKEALAIFDAAVDDYIFGKILDSVSRIQHEPVITPMEFISGGNELRS